MNLPLSFSTFALMAGANRGADAFRVDGNNDMKNALDEAFSAIEAKSFQDAVDEPPPLRNTLLGTEIPCTFEYWQRPDIHTFGNMGIGGAIHAAIAPFATKLIDNKAYGGEDVRKTIAYKLRTLVNKTGARVVDLCCGVGMSTRALESAFCDAEFVAGIDTSPEMISMAEVISGHNQAFKAAMSRPAEALKNFSFFNEEMSEAMAIDTYPYTSSRAVEASYILANAENTQLPNLSFDLVTIFFGFHEVPMDGRNRIINEARSLLRNGGQLAIVDISPAYEPSAPMLAGEPFVIEYQQNIEKQLANLPGFTLPKKFKVVPGHVNLWILTTTDPDPLSRKNK